MKNRILWALLMGLFALSLQAQPNFSFKIQVDAAQQAACLPTGRLLIHLTKQKPTNLVTAPNAPLVSPPKTGILKRK